MFEEAQDSELPIMDLALGAKLLGGDNVAQAELMIATLVRMLPGDLGKVTAAFKAHDLITLKEMAHYIRGGISFCGTPRLKKAIARLDDSIRTGVDLQTLKAAYDNFCSEVAMLVTTFDHHAVRMGRSQSRESFRSV